jgi:hypothetical protein
MSNDGTSINFPFPVLTKIVGRPSYLTIDTLRRECYANALGAGASFGQHGLLGSIMPDDEFLLRNNGTAFVPPVDPGINIPAAERVGDNVVNERNYATQRKLYLTYENMIMQQRIHLIQAIETKYLDELEDPVLGFGLVSAKEILAHLFKTYGKIGPADLDNNLKTLESPWDANEPIAEIWARVKKCRNFAQAGKHPLKDTEVMHKLLSVFDKTGLFGLMCTKYGEMDPDQWDWETFKSDFDGADKHRCSKMTAKSAGFSNANAANAEANATTKDTSNNTSTKQVPTFDPKEHQFCLPEGGDVIFYCYTHGIGTNPNHTSATCTAPAEKHKKNATFKKRMGGSTAVIGDFRNRRNNATSSEQQEKA